MELEGAEAFAEYFQSYDYLSCISLNSTGLNSEGVKILVESLTKSAESGNLSKLDIAENLGSDKETIESLSKLLLSAKRLTHLNISGLMIDKVKY